MEQVLENASRLAEGINSMIYHNTDSGDGKRVVIKILKREHPAHQQVTQLVNEYNHLKDLDIDGVRKPIEKIKIGNKQALILEYFDGITLKEFIEQRHISLNSFLEIAIRLARILDSIHHHQIVHKDFNSNNILINPNGLNIKVIDFGLASKMQLRTEYVGSPELLEGTLAYISPEQTGRINGLIDYRTDLYALGVTLYELLTKHLPFEANDPMELIHAHLALIPTAPYLLDDAIPRPVSEIIMRLLAKNAEERYQSAEGLAADLEVCRDEYLAKDKVSPFKLGTKDFSREFRIPTKLYGRQEELKQLLDTFERASLGPSKMALISGYSGTGKTSLVEEVYKPVTEKRGYFITGKFEQFQQNKPYFAISQGFNKLADIFLSGSEDQLAQWKEKISRALGNEAKLLTDVISNLRYLVEDIPQIPAVGGEEAQNRFNFVFKNFVQAIATKEHPLVLFVDDLQWADHASLRLLRALLSDKSMQYVLVIGAYRNNEVDASHPLMLLINDLEKQGQAAEQIEINDIALDHVQQLIAETVRCSMERSLPLAQVVYSKAGGNPFFVNRFLTTLYEKQLIRYNRDNSSSQDIAPEWVWDINEIEKLNITDNVIELMSGKVTDLEKESQNVLKLAACIGSRFDMHALRTIYGKTTKETAQHLWSAMHEGLIQPIGEHYKVLENDVTEIDTDLLKIEYQFVHDKVQQAIYSLIAEDEKKRIHLELGRLLANSTSDAPYEDRIFDIVNHFNSGIELIDGKKERTEVAKLNFIAGEMAKDSTAYKPALIYLDTSTSLTPEECWVKEYDYTLKLYNMAVEVAFLSGEHNRMNDYAHIVLEKARDTLDKIVVYQTQIISHIAGNESLKAVELALKVLKMLQVNFPDKPSKSHIIRGLLKTSILLRGKSFDTIENLPEMTDKRVLAAMNIIGHTGPAVSRSKPEIFPLIVFKLIQLSLKYGNSIDSIPSYSGYGIILSGVIGNTENGYKFGQLALRLLDKLNGKKVHAKTLVVVHSFLAHWKFHLKESQKPLMDAYCVALESGDQEFAASSLMVHSIYAFLLGDNLMQVEEDIRAHSEKIKSLNQELIFEQTESFRQTILNLTSEVENPTELVGEAYNAQTTITEEYAAINKTALFYVEMNRMILKFLFGDYREAAEIGAKLEKKVDTLIGTVFIPLLSFYNGLAISAQAAITNSAERKKALSKVNAAAKKMKKWSQSSPANYLHKYQLLQAEVYRLKNDAENARLWYDKAIVSAENHGYVNEQAIAYERAALYLMENKSDFPHDIYWQKTYDTYLKWGALTKARSLEAKYPLLISSSSKGVVSKSVSNVDTLKAVSLSDYSTLELSSILKAATTISSEIKLSKVLEKLLKIVIENAGAQKGYLLLDKFDKLFISAKGEADDDRIEILEDIPIEDCGFLPETIVQFVSRTRENVIINDAVEDERFNQDPFIKTNSPTSILCMPIINQGKLIGLIYLENNLTSGAFTFKRIETLKILSGQMAVSLENSMLYDNLEQKVVERTEQIEAQTEVLREKNEELVALNDEKDHLVGVVAHDLRSPLNHIKGMVNLIKLTSKDLNDEQTKFIDLIMESADRMGNMISRILDVNAIDAKEINMKKEVFDLGLLVKELSNNFMLSAEQKNIEIQQSLRKEDSLVSIDKNYTIQVLENIISNAIKFSPRNKTIYLRVNKHGENIRVEVEDQGPGISESDMKKLFGKFQRLTAKPTAGEESTGLGLSIVKKYVEAMGGSIRCESEFGKGANFIVEFPEHA
ncbi:MAG: ATP-binding sensor histidine kinase [Bacteroidota bacterium]